MICLKKSLLYICMVFAFGACFTPTLVKSSYKKKQVGNPKEDLKAFKSLIWKGNVTQKEKMDLLGEIGKNKETYRDEDVKNEFAALLGAMFFDPYQKELIGSLSGRFQSDLMSWWNISQSEHMHCFGANRPDDNCRLLGKMLDIGGREKFEKKGSLGSIDELFRIIINRTEKFSDIKLKNFFEQFLLPWYNKYSKKEGLQMCAPKRQEEQERPRMYEKRTYEKRKQRYREPQKMQKLVIGISGDMELVKDFPVKLSEELKKVGINVVFNGEKPDVNLHLCSGSLAPLIDDESLRGRMEKLAKNSTTNSAIYVHLAGFLGDYARSLGKVKIKDQDSTFSSGIFLDCWNEERDDVFFGMLSGKLLTGEPYYSGQMSQLVKLLRKVAKKR